MYVYISPKELGGNPRHVFGRGEKKLNLGLVLEGTHTAEYMNACALKS